MLIVSLSLFFLPKFRTGVGAQRGGWRKEILPMPEIQAFFLHPCSCVLPSGEGGRIFGELCFAVF